MHEKKTITVLVEFISVFLCHFYVLRIQQVVKIIEGILSSCPEQLQDYTASCILDPINNPKLMKHVNQNYGSRFRIIYLYIYFLFIVPMIGDEIRNPP